MRRQLLTALVFPLRIYVLARYLIPKFSVGIKWLFSSREHTNFTYDLTELNCLYLAQFLSVVCNKPAVEMQGYIQELIDDPELSSHIASKVLEGGRSFLADDIPRYGRRLGWYAIIRAKKPKLVVETGVDKGLGACVIAAALKRNHSEGYSGLYLGTDINSRAGYFLQQPYNDYGRIIYGDSIESLLRIEDVIDVFINDSDHSLDYEANEYSAIKYKLAEDAILIGDNSHFSNKLIEFAQATDRDFLFFQEQPKDHWYPGGGIGVAFIRHSALKVS